MKIMNDTSVHLTQQRYLLNNETIDDCFYRVSNAFSKDKNHKKRMLSYIKKYWFMPSTPVLSNGGTNRGLPISCYITDIEDSLEAISNAWNECIWLGSMGGGLGINWSKVRAVGSSIAERGSSSGIIPFIKVIDSLVLAISQGSLRRGAGAVYLDISHPEIEEFLRIREPSGDFNRKSLNLHQGVNISDVFISAVLNDRDWCLTDPATNEVKKVVKARELFQRILELRITTGEPYLIFIDTVNNNRSPVDEALGLTIKSSNLCSEILLSTGIDHLNSHRTAVCCLGSVNLEYYDEWKDHSTFIEDCLLFLDCVLDSFIEKTEKLDNFRFARYFAERSRSIGLGAMGLHSLFLKKNLSFESSQARELNNSIFQNINKRTKAANIKIAKQYGSCPDAEEAGIIARFSYTQAIAPTASISTVADRCSPSVEPINSNIYTHKTLSGSHTIKNKYLIKVLEDLGKNTPEVWDRILEDGGSVRSLEFLSEDTKKVFKTAFEIDQEVLIAQAGDRAPYIDQGQSINLFFDSTVPKETILNVHLKAWSVGIKSLYYCRSRSIGRTTFVKGSVSLDNTLDRDQVHARVYDRCDISDYEECASCT